MWNILNAIPKVKEQKKYMTEEYKTTEIIYSISKTKIYLM